VRPDDITPKLPNRQSEFLSYDAWIWDNEPRGTELLRQREEAASLLYRPLISIIVPVHDTDEKMLVSMIESVIAQTYDRWELCIADGNSSKAYIRERLQEYINRDKRIKVVFLEENRHIAGNSNEALTHAEGAYVGFLDHDDELAPFALYEIARVLNADPSLDLIYSDEDKIDVHGNRAFPFFKPDWSPDLLLSVNYICHFTVIRHSVLKDLGGFRPGFDGAQDYDLFLRASRSTSRIAHIPKILYHWRDHEQSTATDVSRKDYANEAGIAALSDFLASGHIRANVSSSSVKTNYIVRFMLEENPLVSIIIPFKDKIGLLRKCVESILGKTAYENIELILISNMSREPETFAYLDSLWTNSKVNILTYDEDFNYSKINNFGVLHAHGEVLLFLNNDTEAIDGDWLTFLLEHAQRKEIGAVGCKLLFPDGTIQHAGVVLGITGFAGHVFAGLDEHVRNYFGAADFMRNYLAVTGACLMVRREVFDEVGGFNESFIVCGSDVDFCLRIHSKGYRNIYVPHATLYHHEAASRGTFIPLIDFQLSLDSYGDFLYLRDPYYSPNLTLLKTDCSLRMKDERDAITKIREEALQWARACEISGGKRKGSRTIKTVDMIEGFDFSIEDIESTKKLMSEFEKNRLDISSINWFIPYFRHVYYGGIYTILRFAGYFSKKGIRNRFVLYDSPAILESDVIAKIRSGCPHLTDFDVFIRRSSDVDDIPFADISIATLWTSAYRLLKFNNTRGKFYFIQDYEPLFYPAGSSYALAEATYRFGFHGIVNSPGLYHFITSNYDLHAEFFTPAVEHEVFFPGDRSQEEGKKTFKLFVYGRPQHDRNGFDIAIATAKKAKRSFGESIEIVSAGSEWNPSEFGLDGIMENLGLLGYLETAELYRVCDFGLILMFTKHTSYLPLELMASGSIVIANHNQANSWLLKDGHNCVIIEPSPTFITEKLAHLMKERETRRILRGNALKTTEPLNWQKEMEKIYRFVTAGK